MDCYGESERATGWYYYFQDCLLFPFTAKCIASRSISPLKIGEEVEVVVMAKEDECEHEMFVSIRWDKRKLSVPLSQLKAINASDETIEAVEDWHYWATMGYEF